METIQSKEGLCYRVLESNKVQCTLCPRQCLLGEDQVGFCGVRNGAKEILVTRTYQRASAIQMDPVEKKPLYHFKPKSLVLSVGGVGCTLECTNCQNHHLLSTRYLTQNMTSEALIDMALSLENCSGIAFTYNEPLLQLEWIVEVATLAHRVGLSVIMVSNGYFSDCAIDLIGEHVDAINIDLKGFSENFYNSVCKGHLEIVMNSIEKLANKVHVELTYLAIDPLNTDLVLFKKCVEWISQINPDLPLHISRYFPNYKMALEATPLGVLYTLQGIGSQALNHVYIGNVAGADHELKCSNCRRPVHLESYSRTRVPKPFACPYCGHLIHLIL